MVRGKNKVEGGPPLVSTPCLPSEGKKKGEKEKKGGPGGKKGKGKRAILVFLACWNDFPAWRSRVKREERKKKRKEKGGNTKEKRRIVRRVLPAHHRLRPHLRGCQGRKRKKKGERKKGGRKKNGRERREGVKSTTPHDPPALGKKKG